MASGNKSERVTHARTLFDASKSTHSLGTSPALNAATLSSKQDVCALVSALPPQAQPLTATPVRDCSRHVSSASAALRTQKFSRHTSPSSEQSKPPKHTQPRAPGAQVKFANAPAPSTGAAVGDMVGARVGDTLGSKPGGYVGCGDGCAVGCGVGNGVGRCVGNTTPTQCDVPPQRASLTQKSCSAQTVL